MESILTSIKKLLGIEAEYTQFDTDIIIHINGALMTLRQLGIGPDSGFRIMNDLETWESFLGEGADYEAAKIFVFIKVKLAFDPPTSSAAIEALKRQADEYEWRLQVQGDLMKEE